MNFKRVVAEQLEELVEIESRSRLVPREALSTGKSALSAPNVLAVLGVRRCGKSVFSHMLAKGYNFGYINFDDERLFDVKTKDLDDLLQALYDLHGKIDFIILDEIQKVLGWELFANRLRRTKRVIVTGSNSKLLGREIATELRGRYEDILMLPFSFREYLRYRDISFTPTSIRTAARGSIVAAFDDYIRHGGFPEVVMARNEAERRKLLQNYFKTIFFAIREAPEGQRAARQQTHHRELSPLSPGSIFCHRKREVLFLPPPQDHESEKDLPDRYRFCRAGAPFCGKPGEDT